MGTQKEGYRTLTRREEYLVRLVLKDKGYKMIDYQRYLVEKGYGPLNSVRAKTDSALNRWRSFSPEEIDGLLEFCDYDKRLSFFQTKIGFQVTTPWRRTIKYRKDEGSEIDPRFYEALFEFERDYLMSDEKGKLEMTEKLEGMTWKRVEDKLSEISKDIETRALEDPEILEKLEQFLGD